MSPEFQDKCYRRGPPSRIIYLQTAHIFLPLYFRTETSLDDSYGKSEVPEMCKNSKF